jgi:hypothetical protein
MSVVRSPVRSVIRSVVSGVVASSGPATPAIAQPSITSPTSGATDVALTPTFTSSAFAVTNDGSDTHASSDWQVASDAGFTSIVEQSLDDAVNLESYTVTGPLTVETVYYVRVRHTGTTYGDSAWSAGVSFETTAVSFSLADITVGYYDAANLASQTESDASAPEVGDQVYTADDLSTTPVWGDLARQTTGPTLQADGTSYYWQNTNSGLGRTYSPAATLVDIFMAVRLGADTTGYLFVESGAGKFTGFWQNGSGSAPSGTIGTPTLTVDGGSAITTRGDLYTALNGAGWVLFRVANADPSAWASFRFPNSTSVVDISAVAIVPSSVVGTGSNLTDIVAFMNARIAELNA